MILLISARIQYISRGLIYSFMLCFNTQPNFFKDFFIAPILEVLRKWNTLNKIVWILTFFWWIKLTHKRSKLPTNFGCQFVKLNFSSLHNQHIKNYIFITQFPLTSDTKAIPHISANQAIVKPHKIKNSD